MKVIIFLMLIIFQSCNSNVNCDPEKGEVQEEVCEGDGDGPEDFPDPQGELTPIPEVSFYTNVGMDKSFDLSQSQRVEYALELIVEIVQSEDFKKRVLSHSYQGDKTYVNNLNLSNEEIYQKLLLAAEDLRQIEDNTMDMTATLYYSNNSTVGYTYPNTMNIWLNTKFFNDYSIPELCNTLFHEWTHKLGFDHDSNVTTRRNYSVPYGIGEIVETLAKSIVENRN